MREKIIHRNQEIVFEIPENYYELKLLKIRLETEYSLLKEALKLEQTNKQRQRLRKQEISPLKSKIKAVNMALSRFKGESNQRNRLSKKGISQKYQRMLLALKEELSEAELEAKRAKEILKI